MKCKGCRYLGKDCFENTCLRTCNVAYYLIERVKKLDNGFNIYSVDALRSEEDECFFIKEQEIVRRK